MSISEEILLIMETIREESREIPVRGHWDVIVAGGGLGGVAAAIASARTGARTLLVERNTYVGGVATAGMCCSVFNCFYTSEKKLGPSGIQREIVDNLAESGGFGKKWHEHKGHIIYDLECGKFVLQDMLEKAGVETLFSAVSASVVMDGNRLKGLIVESKSGRQALLADNIVDATGDGDVAFMAGAPLHIPSVENSRQHSLCFRLGNVDVDAFIDYFRKNPSEYPEMMDVEWTLEEALRQYDECGTFLFPHGGGIQMNAFRKAKEDKVLPPKIGMHDTTDACQMHGMRRNGVVHVVTGYVRFDGLDAESISRAISDGRRMAFTLGDVYKRYIPGFGNSFVAGVANNLGIRSSRWLDGDFVMTGEMASPGVRCEDAVGKLVPYRDIVRHKGPRAWGVQVMGSDTFDLPYACLLPKKIEGLIMGSGRSVSSKDPWLMRVMVYTMTVGQAAGAAAGIASKRRTSLRNLDTALVRDVLRGFGEKF